MDAIRLSGQEKERNKEKRNSTRRQLLVVVILLDTETDLTSHMWLFIRDYNAKLQCSEKLYVVKVMDFLSLSYR